MAVYMAIILAIGVAVYLYTGNANALWLSTGIAIVMNIGSFWFGDKIVLAMEHARPVTRKEYFDCWNALENLCISIGKPMPKLYVIDDPAPNAFATGRSPKHSSIAVTTGLLAILNKRELEGVLAHELAHVQNRDTLLMIVTAVLLSTVYHPYRYCYSCRA